MPPAKKENVSTRNNPPQKTYRHIAVIFVILVLLVVLAVVYLALSEVTITLVPSDEPVSFDFNLIIADNPENNSATNVILPGQILSESAETEQLFSVTTGKAIDAPANGKVILYNNQAKPQSLVATTRLLTADNILFRLQDKVTIPAGGTIEAKVYADQAGATGNIPPATFSIPGLSESVQKIVFAKSTVPMTGGTRQIGMLTEADLENAKDELIKNKSGETLTKFIGNAGESSFTLIDTKVDLSDVAYDKKIGEEVDAFTLTGKINIQAVLADKNAILELAKTKLLSSVGPKGEFISIDPSSLQYELLDLDVDKKEATFKVALSGLATLDPGQDLFDKNLLVGFTEEDLKLYFSQFASVREARISFSPFWVKKVPILKDHIIIKIEKQ